LGFCRPERDGSDWVSVVQNAMVVENPTFTPDTKIINVVMMKAIIFFFMDTPTLGLNYKDERPTSNIQRPTSNLKINIQPYDLN
jgi:hypothetical protein